MFGLSFLVKSNSARWKNIFLPDLARALFFIDGAASIAFFHILDALSDAFICLVPFLPPCYREEEKPFEKASLFWQRSKQAQFPSGLCPSGWKK